MVLAFEELRKLETLFSKLKEQNRVVDYRIILKLNMSANIYIVTDKASFQQIESLTKETKLLIDIEFITEEEFHADNYYDTLFKNTKTLDWGLRRSLSNIMENDDHGLDSCPIVSFYSYKGGVGRTTALALFASYYSIVHSKKVFIIDCDFEAPGLINFYGIKNEDLPKNGFVEYIKDKEASFEINLHDNYVYEVSKKYSGDGEIHLLPAGNIFDPLDRTDYIEALARIDIHSSTTMISQFSDVISDINKEYNPDVILIDARTGFSDVFGIISNRLSDIVVGFFGNNVQNIPGLHFFLDILLKKRNVNLILVLSILSSSFSKELSIFRDKINEYIQSNIEDELTSLPALPIFYLSRYPSLEKVGTDDEDPDDFVTAIERRMLSDVTV
jgi:cellulose biosynthesis protein BcsQ